MKISSFFTVLITACAVAVGGCKQQDSSASAQVDHDHAHDHSHDHSVAGHAHGIGPHDGTIVDWGGGKYHVELTVDHDKKEATAYVLGGDEKTPTPIAVEEIELTVSDPEMLVVLKTAPQEGDPEGSTSRFIGSNEMLGVDQNYQGVITGVIDGTPYSGDFDEAVHDPGAN